METGPTNGYAALLGWSMSAIEPIKKCDHCHPALRGDGAVGGCCQIGYLQASVASETDRKWV